MLVAEEQFPLYVDPTLPGHPNPYPLFHRLRTDAPVHFSPFMNGWVLTRYGDAIAYLRDSRFSRVAYMDTMRAKFGDDQPILKLQAGELAFNDAPNHTALRGLIGKAFTPAAIAGARPQIKRASSSRSIGCRARGAWTWSATSPTRCRPTRSPQ